MFLIYDGRESFYQWDLDRKLIVKDSTIKEVHFCNKTDDCSLVCETYTEGGLNIVNVPNILLQDNWRINVYAYDSNYTKFSTVFDVIKRSKPANYIYTETEVKRWEDLEERIVYLEENGTGSGGGSNIKIDTTLTVEGAAADAKVVGEKFDYLRKYNGWIDTQTGVYIDTSAKTLTFGANTYITYGNQLHNVSNTTHDISTMIGGAWVYLDVSKQPYTLTKNRNTQYTVLLGALWKPNHLADFHMDKTKLYVDGMPITYVGRYSGKTINCLGDSMTEGVGTTKAYHQWFGQLCGFKNIKVYGLGGSSITPIGSHEPAWTGEESILSFYERYSDMGDADAISVMGCVNDWATGRELGRITDTTTDTFYGTMKLLCEGLIAKYPTKDIYFFSSPQTDYIHRPANKIAGTNWAGNIEGYNRKGYKLEDYSRAMGEVCAIYGIPFMSLTDNCYWGLSGVLGEYQNDEVNGVYGSDSLHPNAEGHKRIALKMSSVINNGYGSGNADLSKYATEEYVDNNIHGCSFYATATFDDTLSSITFSEDANGNPISLDECWIIIKYTSETSYLATWINDIWLGYRHGVNGSQYALYETQHYTRFGDSLYGIISISSDNAISGMNQGIKASGITRNVFNGNKIEKIRVGLAYGKSSLEGATVEIYGR